MGRDGCTRFFHRTDTDGSRGSDGWERSPTLSIDRPSDGAKNAIGCESEPREPSFLSSNLMPKDRTLGRGWIRNQVGRDWSGRQSCLPTLSQSRRTTEETLHSWMETTKRHASGWGDGRKAPQ
eukprot:scaffold882_cov384-Pavlova_lutheri.AAC.2